MSESAEAEDDPHQWEPVETEQSELAIALEREIAKLSGERKTSPLLDLLCRLRNVVEEWDRHERPADAGENAEPWDPDSPAAIPHPDPDGRFLMIAADPLANGRLTMRRYATKEDAVVQPINYLGARHWVFEIVREIPRSEFMDWDGFVDVMIDAMAVNMGVEPPKRDEAPNPEAEDVAQDQPGAEAAALPAWEAAPWREEDPRGSWYVRLAEWPKSNVALYCGKRDAQLIAELPAMVRDLERALAGETVDPRWAEGVGEKAELWRARRQESLCYESWGIREGGSPLWTASYFKEELACLIAQAPLMRDLLRRVANADFWDKDAAREAIAGSAALALAGVD